MLETHHLLIGSLGAAVPGAQRMDLGLDHPSHAGLLELHLTTEDGTVRTAEPRIGAMHRGVEKLFEVRDYRQILMLANRHDWQAPFFGELAAARLFEEMMGLPVPPRAAALRVLLAEHARVTSHLGQLSWLAHHCGHSLQEHRERLREVLVMWTGNRIHPMVTRLGGLAEDPDARAITALVDAMDAAAAAASRLVIGAEFEGVAPVPEGTVDAWGLSGPLARSAGVASDLRRDDPDYADVLDLLEPHASTGDAAARFAQMIGEVSDSARIVARLAPRIPDGPVGSKLPKIVKLPEGSGHLMLEGALGRTGFRVVSRGQKTPWRMKLRTPSFQHVAALEVLLPGTRAEDVEAALASVGWVVGDLDK